MNNEDNNDKAKSPAAAAPKPEGPKPAPVAKAAAPKRTGAGRTLARLFLLLIIIGGLTAAGWFGWQWLRAEKARHDARIAGLESQLAELRDGARATHDAFEEARRELGTEQDALRDRVRVIAGNMNDLRDAAQGGRRDLMRAEIEYLLRIAADELYLTQDVDTAIYALNAADDRLRQLGEPRFIPVRQLINDHLRDLGAVNMPDITGMALKLGSLAREVSSLPLRQSEHARALGESGAAAPVDAGWWPRFRAGIARVFDKLVVVQRAAPPPPLLAPDEHFFLYRNVELQLAAARTALLAGDTASYRQSLETAREWLGRYFDTADPAVTSALADITGLLEMNVQPALPDIAPALEQFRKLADDPAAGARTE